MSNIHLYMSRYNQFSCEGLYLRLMKLSWLGRPFCGDSCPYPSGFYSNIVKLEKLASKVVSMHRESEFWAKVHLSVITLAIPLLKIARKMQPGTSNLWNQLHKHAAYYSHYWKDFVMGLTISYNRTARGAGYCLGNAQRDTQLSTERLPLGRWLVSPYEDEISRCNKYSLEGLYLRLMKLSWLGRPFFEDIYLCRFGFNSITGRLRKLASMVVCMHRESEFNLKVPPFLVITGMPHNNIVREICP